MSRHKKTGVDGMKEGTHAKRILNHRNLWASVKYLWRKRNCPTSFSAVVPETGEIVEFEIKRDYGKDTILVSVKDEDNFIWREEF